MQYVIRMTFKMVSYGIRVAWILVVSRPDLWTMQYAIRMTYDAAISYPDGIRKSEPYVTRMT